MRPNRPRPCLGECLANAEPLPTSARANLLRVEAERRHLRELVSGWPWVLYDDPSNLCNLT